MKKQQTNNKNIPRTVVKNMRRVLTSMVRSPTVKQAVKKSVSVMKQTAQRVLANKVQALEQKVHTATQSYTQSVQSYIRHQCAVECAKVGFATKKDIALLQNKIARLEQKINKRK
jgi:uncharacterized protein CbrC (UPF0167 family)